MNDDPLITPPDEPDPELGRVLRRLRQERGLSLADLAARSEVDQATLTRLEEGALDPPWTTVEAIARSLGYSLQGIADAVAAERGEQRG